MIVHVVLFTWKDGIQPSQIEALSSALGQLPSQVPELQEIQYGVDAGLRTGNSQFGLVATFLDEAGWRAYQAHPAHVAVLHDFLTPMVASRCAIQFTH